MAGTVTMTPTTAPATASPSTGTAITDAEIHGEDKAGNEGTAPENDRDIDTRDELLQKIQLLEAALEDARGKIAGLEMVDRKNEGGEEGEGVKEKINPVETVPPGGDIVEEVSSDASMRRPLWASDPAGATSPASPSTTKGFDDTNTISVSIANPTTDPLSSNSHNLHLLLLLCDSSLPLGSFAFSSSLESYLVHLVHLVHLPTAQGSTSINTLTRFLSLSITSLATSTLPYLISSYTSAGEQEIEEGGGDQPIWSTKLTYLDDHLDASTICPVTRRASTTQGKALLTIFEKSIAPSLPLSALQEQLTLYRTSTRTATSLAHGHLPICFGAVCRACNIPLRTTCYIYLLNHTKSILSAAVRVNLIGPYLAQRLLAGRNMQECVWRGVEIGWEVWRTGCEGGEEVGIAAGQEDGEEEEGVCEAWLKGVQNAGQCVPTLDLYQGRHELLYSRVFNS